MSDRRVGVEIEFSGIDFGDAVKIVTKSLDAEQQSVSEHEVLLDAPGFSDQFRIEVDFELLKELSREVSNECDQVRNAVVGLLDVAAAIATPLELVTPPLHFEQMARLDRLINDLVKGGAVGTQDSVAYAFGVHFNPNVTVLDPEIVIHHVRAFICLFEWLRLRDQMDVTRRLSAFAQPYPKSYELLVLSADYQPDADTLIRDYLKHNRTRNRALDLLPLFSHWNDALLRESIDDVRIKSRPTYHYRLPNSRLGDKDWSILDPWRDWLTVEALAADSLSLAKLASERLNHINRRTISAGTELWIAECQKTVKNLELA